MVTDTLASRKKVIRRVFAPALLAGFLFTGCQQSVTSIDEEDRVWQTFPAEALKDYLPRDAAAVFTIDVQRLRAAPVFGKGLEEAVKQLLRKDEVGRGWLPLTGIDPIRDLDEARVVLSSRDVYDPLVILHGRFDPSLFQTDPDKLTRRVVDQEGSRSVLFEYQDRQRGEIVKLATAGDYLIACDSRSPVLAALRHAATPGPMVPMDNRLRELLDKVDRRQQVWLAVSMEKLRPVPRLDNKVLQMILHPVLQYADAIQGGITCDEDVRADFTFQTRDEADAKQLEVLLRSSCEVAQGIPLLPGVDKTLLPLFKLAGTGEVAREGSVVRMKCRMGEE